MIKDKECPFTGRKCLHIETCNSHTNVVKCWVRECYIDNQPEGQTTGRHRDSMG